MLNKFPALSCNCFQALPPLTDGMPVNEETIQASLQSLYANDVYLKTVLDYFEMPSALTKCVEVDPAIQPGQVVYYSESDQKYMPAKFETVASIGGRVYLSETAEVWGIVREKTTVDSALIVICGIAELDLTNAGVSMPAAGKYYLSTTPGMLVDEPEDETTPVYVLTATPDGNVLFRPWSGEYAGLVLQWKHSLLPEAAGVYFESGGNVQINSPDADLPGWLPADHPVFDGNAPAGAVFGYNIQQDADLASRWPPRFLQTVHLDFDRAIDPNVGGTTVPLGADGLAIVNADGIWWMANCVDDSPFNAAPSVPPSPGACPREPQKRLIMYAARPAGTSSNWNGQMSLQSLHPAIRLQQRDTTAIASSGDLDIALRLLDTLPMTPNDVGGYSVKPGDNSRYGLGPTVTSIRSTTPALLVTGTESYGPGGELKHGEVLLESTGITNRELYPATTAANRTEERKVYGTLSIGLARQRNSSFRSMFFVPGDIAGDFELSFRVWIMAHFPNSGTAVTGDEQLTLSVQVIPPPNPSVDISATVPQSISIPVSPVDNGKAFQQISDVFTAPSGSIVYAELSRTPASALYELHAVRHFLYVENVTPAGP